MTDSIIIAIIFILVISIAVIYFYARGDCYISYEIFADRSNQKIHLENVDESIVDCVLAVICEAFDMDPADSGRIREHDTVKAIYDSWYRGSFVPCDDCELERFHAMLKALIHLTDKDMEVTDDFLKMPIGEIMTFIARIRHNAPVSDSEKEFIIYSQSDIF